MRVDKTLNSISTCNLVEELKGREGTEYLTAEPYEEKAISIEGPAVILIIRD